MRNVLIPERKVRSKKTTQIRNLSCFFVSDIAGRCIIFPGLCGVSVSVTVCLRQLLFGEAFAGQSVWNRFPVIQN